MAKYEAMKAKLDATKGSLDEKQKQITNQAALTEKITAMKERVEQYAAKKEAVSALTEHVAIRQVLQQNKLDVVNEELDQEDDRAVLLLTQLGHQDARKPFNGEVNKVHQ